MLRCDNKNTPTPPQAINNDRSLGPERIKGIVLADCKKRNLISIHEMLFLAFKYIFWPIHQQKNEQIILKPVNRFFKRLYSR